MSADQRNWADYMGRAEFGYNVAMQSRTKESPLVVAYEVNTLQPTDLALKEAHSILEFNQDCKDLAKKREQMLKMTKLLVVKAQKRYEEQVDAGGQIFFMS